MRERTTLIIGVVLGVFALYFALSESPPRIAGTNHTPLTNVIDSDSGGHGGCQPGGTIPSDTSDIRLDMSAVAGPRVTLSVRSHGQIVTTGATASGWIGESVAVPITQLRHIVPDATVCFVLGPSSEVVSLLGGGNPLRLRIEYLASGDRPWRSLLLPVARRIGLGREPSGTWIAPLIALLMAGVAVSTAYLCTRDLGNRRARRHRFSTLRLPLFAGAFRRVPSAAWICMLVAFLNAAAWSLLSPPFQAPDEPDHFAYVQQLAEAHHLPTEIESRFSLEEETALTDLRQERIRFRAFERTISSRLQQVSLEHDLAQPLSRKGPGGAGVATSEPPLYYTLETIPYSLGSGDSLLVRLQMMRLLSAFFGGLTALFAFLFTREALPGASWAWTVGGLGVALAPLLGFISGAVNPDALLATVSAALFYLLARAYRRGLTPSLSLTIGVVSAIGFLTKLNFFGLAPGVLLGLVVLASRGRHGPLHTVCITLLGLAPVATLILLYVALVPSAGHASLKLVSLSASAAQSSSIWREVSYVWGLYLPRLPSMTNYFLGLTTWRQLWFNRLIGLYGWADTLFPTWFYSAALVPSGLILLLCLRTLIANRATVRRRVGEFFVYGAVGVGILVLVGVDSYVSDVQQHSGPSWEPRYLLPLLPLVGAVLALGARGAGRRWGPAAGVLIVILVLGQDIASQLQIIARYYG